jgi:hypothetical protein
MLRPALTAFLLIVLGACTPMRWEHPSFGTAQATPDLNDCARSARYEAMRFAWSDPFWGAPSYYRGRDGRLYVDPFARTRYRDPWFYEDQLRDYCMRSKGYRLVPVPEAKAG